MLAADPWEKAAECARAIESTADRQDQAVLTSLRDLWISLANARNFMSTREFVNEVERIGRVHRELTSADSRAINSHRDSPPSFRDPSG
jgi:hypothetical protein